MSEEKASLSDYVFGPDILAATRFKPWWETLRFYAVAGLFVAAILIIHTMKPSSSLVCLPVGNVTSRFDELGADAVSRYCSKFDRGGWFFRNVGFFAMAASVVIFILYCWWIFVPRVRFTFSSLRRFDDKIKEFLDEMDGINPVLLTSNSATVENSEKTRKDKEKLLKIGRSLGRMINEMNRFQPRFPSITIPVIYIIRNIIGLIAITVNLYVLYVILHVKEVPFHCVVESISAECIYDVVDKLKPFVGVAMILLSVIGIISLIGLVMTALGRCQLSSLKLQYLNRKQDYAFAIYFGKHSTPLSQMADSVLKRAADALVQPIGVEGQQGSTTEPKNVNTEKEPLIDKT